MRRLAGRFLNGKPARYVDIDFEYRSHRSTCQYFLQIHEVSFGRLAMAKVHGLVEPVLQCLVAARDLMTRFTVNSAEPSSLPKPFFWFTISKVLVDKEHNVMATINGTSGNETLSGTTGDDTLLPLAGNDTIDGGGGTDTVVLSGARINYNISQTFTGYLVQDTVGGTGSKTIANVELLQFSDSVANLSIAGDARTISTAQLNSLTELYIAYFNREPEATGLDYWIKALADGQTLEQIGSTFYAAATLPEFATLTGYSATMTNTDFVRIIYANVLGRSGSTAPPQADVDYWANNLAIGHDTRGSLINTMLGAAHSYKGDATWGWVPDLLDNKVSVGIYHAVTAGIDYLTPTDAISHGMEIAAAVTSSDTTAAINLIGLAPQTDFQSPPMPV